MNILNDLKAALEKGDISPDDIVSLFSSPTEDEQDIATILHTIFCYKKHPMECKFYDSKDWILSDRTIWIDDARHLKELYKDPKGKILIRGLQIFTELTKIAYDFFSSYSEERDREVPNDLLDLISLLLKRYMEKKDEREVPMKEQPIEGMGMIDELLSRFHAPITPPSQKER